MSSEAGERKKIELTYWKNQEPPQSGKLYEDPLFPPNKNSLLGLDSNGKPIDSKAYNEKAKNINTNQIGFARASEIFGNKYKLFSEKIEMDDVIQGQLGDCYFLSSVANLCKFPSLIMRLFKTKETNKDGFYEIILHIDGKPQIVIVDDYLPVQIRTKTPVYAQSKGKEIWVMLLEKAWAKVNGGYANIISGLPCEALEFLTGLGSLTYDTENMDADDINEYKYEIVKNVQIADQNNCLISCSTTSNQNIEKVGLVEGHAYTLVSFTQITTSQGKKVYLFRIRNPWSQGEWTGDWSDKSKLWDEKTKSQVNFKDKEDGIFFMNDTDFFKYFTHVEICYILYDSISATYTIDGAENLQNGSVFNIVTEGEGFLSVSVSRKSWRANRELRDKILPTHISVVKYNPKPSSRLKTFSDYNGTFDSFQTCAINVRVTKGNYLIYVYRDFDHAQFTADKTMDVKIVCSAKFKHAQMSYDYRNKGFPLLQNIILQAEFQENNYDPDLGEDFDVNSNQLRGNGIGHIIFYISTPGYYLDFTGGTANVKNYIMLCPYLDNQTTTFHRAVPSGKYLIFLGLMSGVFGSYSFNCFTKAYTTNRKLTVEFDNNDIDLTLYTDINNDIKNEKVKERRTQSLENAQKEFYFDIGDGTVQYTTLAQLQKTYGNYIKLLDDVTLSKQNSNLKWGIIKGEYVTYIGQFNGDKKEGKGLFINPNNIFAGEFLNDQQNGVGYTYNKDFTRLYYCTYVNGVRKGKPITPEDEQKMKEEEEEKKRLEEEKKKEEEIKKEQERLKKLEEEKQALLKKQEEEKKRLEEQLKEELRKAEEAKRLEEERIAEAKRKAEEEAKRLEEERQKELQRQKEELERLEQQKLEAEKKAQELKKQEEERLKKEMEEAERQRKLEEERIQKELERLAKEKEEEAKKKMEELKKQEEELKQKAKKEAEEAERKMKEAEEEAKRKEEEARKEAERLKEEAKKEAERKEEEARKKAEEAKKEAERLEEEARKKAEEAKKEAERLEEEAKKKKEEAGKKIDEIKEDVQKAKDDAKKINNDYNDFIGQVKKDQEERQKRREQRMKEEREKLEQAEQNGTQFGVKFYYPDYHKSKKRRQKMQLPFEQEMMDICVTCGCNIF